MISWVSTQQCIDDDIDTAVLPHEFDRYVQIFYHTLSRSYKGVRQLPNEDWWLKLPIQFGGFGLVREWQHIWQQVPRWLQVLILLSQNQACEHCELSGSTDTLSIIALRLLNSLRTGELSRRGRDQADFDMVGQFIHYFEATGFVFENPLPYWVHVCDYDNALQIAGIDPGTQGYYARKQLEQEGWLPLLQAVQELTDYEVRGGLYATVEAKKGYTKRTFEKRLKIVQEVSLQLVHTDCDCVFLPPVVGDVESKMWVRLWPQGADVPPRDSMNFNIPNNEFLKA